MSLYSYINVDVEKLLVEYVNIDTNILKVDVIKDNIDKVWYLGINSFYYMLTACNRYKEEIEVDSLIDDNICYFKIGEGRDSVYLECLINSERKEKTDIRFALFSEDNTGCKMFSIIGRFISIVDSADISALECSMFPTGNLMFKMYNYKMRVIETKFVKPSDNLEVTKKLVFGVNGDFILGEQIIGTFRP